MSTSETIALPEYFPFNLEFEKEFEKVSGLKTTLTREVSELVDGILADSKRTVEYMLSENSANFGDILATNLLNMEKLLRSHYELVSYRASVEKTKHEIKEASLSESRLSLENLGEYVGIGETKLNFAEEIAKQYQANKPTIDQETNFQAYLKTNKSFRELANIVFVIENPMEPIPDDEEDEELRVSGGKLTLKDPLSLKFFTDPFITKKCKHTFDKETITNHLTTNRKCPISGCNETLSSRDLVEDALMKIRVSVYLQKEKERGKDRNEGFARVT